MAAFALRTRLALQATAMALPGLLTTVTACAQPAQPLVFLGDRDLRPYEFLDSGQPRGANVELIQAVARVMGRPVEVRLAGWNEAQARVMAGEGHGLTFLGRTPEREAHFVFSQPTMPVSFALFVRADDQQRFTGSLDGMVIGATRGGLTRKYLAEHHPGARLVLVDNLLDGTRQLVRHEIDALAAQEWSQYALLNELGIRGVTGLPAFLRREGNIAVRRDEAALLADIDQALAHLKASGEFDRILDRWSYTKVHLLSHEQATILKALGTVAVLALAMLSAMLLWQRRQRQAMAREIEQRRRLELALEEANRAKDRFLATVAHELRNPLAALLNAARVLELKGGGVPEVRWVQSLMERQTSHLTRLVDDLLDVGRIDSGKLELRREAATLDSVVADAVDVCRPRMEACGHHFVQELPAQPLWLDADRTRLAQVLINLLTNAIKYSPAPGRIELLAQRQDASVVLSVRDYGLGIAAQQLQAVFELFHQEDRSRAQSGGGLGIGLWLSRRLVEMHGGSLTLYSQGEGLGSTFTVRLPLANPAASTGVAIPEALPSAAHPVTPSGHP